MLCDVVPEADARLHHADAEVHRGHTTLLDAIFAGCGGDALINRQPLAVEPALIARQRHQVLLAHELAEEELQHCHVAHFEDFTGWRPEPTLKGTLAPFRQSVELAMATPVLTLAREKSCRGEPFRLAIELGMGKRPEVVHRALDRPL